MRKKAAVFFMVILATVLLSCGKKEEKVSGYIEEKLKIPEEIICYDNIKVLKDGTIVLFAATDDEDYCLYTSSDQGEIWEKEELIDEEIYSVDINENKDKIIEYDKGEEYALKYIKQDGTAKEIDCLSNEVIDLYKDVYFVGNDKILVRLEDGISLVNLVENKIEFKIKLANYIQEYVVFQNSLIICDLESSTVIQYNLSNGEEITHLAKLEEEVANTEEVYFRGFCPKSDDEGIYYYTQKGIYYYNINNDSITEVVDGEDNSIGYSMNYLWAVDYINDKDFITILEERSFTEESAFYIMRYKYTTDEELLKKDEATIYSLYYNETLESLIYYYEQQNKNVNLHLEIGVSWNDGMVESDAIKKLNTEMMAGDGPDIILLDGFDQDAYLKKGLLADISDVVNETREQEELFNNIIDLYKTKEGIYAIPLSFSMPTVVGEKNILAGITDLNSLTEAYKGISEEGDKSFIEKFSENEIVELLYFINNSNWINEDNSINRDTVSAFLESAAAIKKSIDDNNDINSYMDMYRSYDTDCLVRGIYLPNMMRGSRLETGSITDPINLMYLYAVKKGGNDLDYKILNNKIVPQCTLAVNERSGNKELAKDVIKYMLTEKFLAKVSRNMFTINKGTYGSYAELNGDGESTIGITLKDGSEINYKVDSLSEAELARLIGEIESISTKEIVNNYLLEALKNSFTSYNRGQCSLEQAVDKVENNLNIYLSE